MECTDLLPSIPSLPPLLIPNTSLRDHENTKSQLPKAPQNPSSTSFNLSSGLATSAAPESHPSGQQPLPKSISVDSLPMHPRPNVVVSTGDASPKSSIISTGSPRVYSLESLQSDESRNSPPSIALQASSTGSVDGASETTPGPVTSPTSDLDSVPSTFPHRGPSLFRESTEQGKESIFRPVLRGGELALPSRSQAVGRLGPAIREEPTQRLRSISSAHFPPRHLDITAGLVVGRPRSGSLGNQLSNTGRYTPVSARGTSKLVSEVTIAVVGPFGCGKSAAVQKALKRFGLSDPVTLPLPPGVFGSKMASNYSRRTGSIPSDEHFPDRSIYVLEVESPLTFDRPTSRIWPEFLPKLHGVIVCYDASFESSFQPVQTLVQGFRDLNLPIVVLSCKSDLQRQVEPEKVAEILRLYDVGLVEVSTVQKIGKERLKQAFEFLLTAISRDRRTNRNENDTNYRNPASPDVLKTHAWDRPRTTTMNHAAAASPSPWLASTTHVERPPAPVRARSTNDLLSERERGRAMERQLEGSSVNELPLIRSNGSGAEVQAESKESVEHGPRLAQWATLEELLDKLIFLAVTRDDPSFVVHFLLTYRRFATPRSIILAMQRRIRQLDNSGDDPMFACFGQMRICHLLESWIREYPHDFAVHGTAGALSALVKSIISKTYLLHYGSDFLPFLELLPTLHDKDASWAMKMEQTANESDDSRSLFDDDDDRPVAVEVDPSMVAAEPNTPPPTNAKPGSSTIAVPRERRPSLPVPKPTVPPGHEGSDALGKQLIKDLLKVAQEINIIDSDEIACEITRMETQMFLAIEPRHWLQYTFTPGRKDPQADTVASFNQFSNHLASWVVSLILCHDKPRARAKQIEKFIEVAMKLRSLNNYSALRAFVAGINNSTFPTDVTMELLRQRSSEHAKNLQSWDLLFQSRRSHRAYRMALRSTKGACIPALEVHVSDLIQAHEGNTDANPTAPNKIHWGKYNMIGKFIGSTTQCQVQCRTTTDYDFPERPRIRELLQREKLMDEELQRSRISPPDTDPSDDVPRNVSRENPNTQTRDAVLRRIIFW